VVFVVNENELSAILVPGDRLMAQIVGGVVGGSNLFLHTHKKIIKKVSALKQRRGITNFVRT
jgi:hypothetical protein